MNVLERGTKEGLTVQSENAYLHRQAHLLADIIAATLTRDGAGNLCYITANGVPMRLPPEVARRVNKAIRGLKELK